MSVPRVCWLLLLLTIVLATVAADMLERDGERMAAVACGIVVAVAAVTAIALYTAKYWDAELPREDISAEGFRRHLEETRE